MSMAKVMMNNLPAGLTPEETTEIETAEKMPIFFDNDCPEMTDKMLKQFHRPDTVMVKISPDRGNVFTCSSHDPCASLVAYFIYTGLCITQKGDFSPFYPNFSFSFRYISCNSLSCSDILSDSLSIFISSDFVYGSERAFSGFRLRTDLLAVSICSYAFKLL